MQLTSSIADIEAIFRANPNLAGSVPTYEAHFAQLVQWTNESLQSLSGLINSRRRAGMVREGHGDLHSDNIVLLYEGNPTFESRLVPFDCLEFSEAFRFTDTMSDMSFLFMDLKARLLELGDRVEMEVIPSEVHQLGQKLPQFALNAYLEASGDYEGVKLLTLFEVHRALIRAKVSLIRAIQQRQDQAASLKCARDTETYLRLACEQLPSVVPSHVGQRILFLMCGFSGSGKSAVAHDMPAYISRLIRVSSDVERKRLFRSDDSNRYSETARAAVYTHMLRHAETILGSAMSALIDATFTSAAARRPFIELAARLNVRCVLVWLHAAPEKLRERVIARKLMLARHSATTSTASTSSDADLQTLEEQLKKGLDTPGDGSERGNVAVAKVDIATLTQEQIMLIIRSWMMGQSWGLQCLC